ncbi:MAG: hypothetical protein WAV28_10810 [Sedimentisphaerales bacterium]
MCSIEEENERQYRVLDQMLTMHARLRDRYSRRALFINIMLLVSAVALNTFVFAGEDVFRLLGIAPGHARIAIGVISVLLLVIALVEYKVNWAGLSKRHEDAADRLACLKGKYRTDYASRQKTGALPSEQLGREYALTMEILSPIPDRLFNKLKGYCLFKRLVSEEISKNPKVPALLIKFRFRVQGIWAFLKTNNKTEEKQADNAKHQ